MSFILDDEFEDGAGGGASSDAAPIPAINPALDMLDAFGDLDPRVLADLPQLRERYEDIVELSFAKIMDVLASPADDRLAVTTASRILTMFIKQQTQTRSDDEMAALRAEFEDLCAAGRDCFATRTEAAHGEGRDGSKVLNDGIL